MPTKHSHPHPLQLLVVAVHQAMAYVAAVSAAVLAGSASFLYHSKVLCFLLKRVVPA